MGLAAELSDLLEDASLCEASKEALIQKIFNLKPDICEQGIKTSNPNLYAGLAQEALSTSFLDYHSVLEDLKDGDALVDLGAGYAKGSLLCQALGLKKTCVSLELSQERIQHSKNISRERGLDPGLIRQFDLRIQQPPLAEAYFVYLPLGELIFKPLESLLDRKHPCVFYVVESHGDVIDFFESLSWFNLEKVLTSASPRYKMGVYKFRFSPKKIEALDINSYQLIYWLLQNYSKSPSIGLVKESASAQVSASDLTPLKHNGQMMFESLAFKRIVDFKNVYVSSASLGG